MIDTSSSTFNTINLDNKYYKRKNKIITFLSSKKKLINNKQKILVVNLSNMILKNQIDDIDVLKIDTEGYEFKILKGIKDNDFKKIKYIYFEHHYDLMINKKYKFSDINNLLIKKNFNKVYKLKMKFRKSLNIFMKTKIKIPKVSVVIVNYNNAKYLEKCIKSLLNQSYRNIEIIIVDDKSTDNSFNILKKYRKKATIIFNKKKTSHGSYNQINSYYRGYLKSKGKYLFF